ncbi:Bromodomain-containing protein [Mycena capillaripes]|nr:Bromodomain-containing protein [Mycena capillaripes]
MSVPHYGPPCGRKRKHRTKSMSPTPFRVNENDDEDRQPKRRKALLTNKSNEVPPIVRQKMKKIFDECYRSVVACEDQDGRERCELFRELPDRKEYSVYYQLITQPIALSHLRERGEGLYYKDLQHYRNDWALMFNNARTFNEEGSWVNNDAIEMEKVLDATFQRLTVGSGLPGAQSNGSYESALTPMDEDDRPPPTWPDCDVGMAESGD